MDIYYFYDLHSLILCLCEKRVWACTHGEKLSRLTENAKKSLQTKSRLVMKMRLYETKSYPSTEISLVGKRNLGKMFSPYEHNFSSPSGKLSVASVKPLYMPKFSLTNFMCQMFFDGVN